jgi:hypothetical protein
MPGIRQAQIGGDGAVAGHVKSLEACPVCNERRDEIEDAGGENEVLGLDSLTEAGVCHAVSFLMRWSFVLM